MMETNIVLMVQMSQMKLAQENTVLEMLGSVWNMESALFPGACVMVPVIVQMGR